MDEENVLEKIKIITSEISNKKGEDIDGCGLLEAIS